MRKASVFCVVAVLGLLASSSARAQDTGGTPNYPPPGSGTPNYPPPAGTPTAPPPPSSPPPPGAAPAPGAAPLPAAAPAPYREGGEVEPKDEGRIRVGFNVNGGVGSGGDFSGPTVGGTFRIGWQINHLMGAYAQVSLFGWFASTSKTLAGQSFEISAIGGQQFTPMFSLSPVDLLEIAAGPSIDRLNGGSTSTTISNATISERVTAYSGFYFGLHGRIALHIGGKPNTTTGRRVGFSIGGDIHPSFAEGNTITFYTLGLGADWY